MSGVVAHPLTRARWADLELLFGPSGAYSNCWCAFQRVTGSEFSRGCADRGAGNRALLRALTRDGGRPGLIAYRDRRPVGWVSAGPQREFGRILRSPVTRLAPPERDNPTVWAVVCFFVPRAERGAGVGRLLLDAAVDRAQRSGAAWVEGYPVDTRGGRVQSSTVFTGTLDLFERSGFVRAAEHVPGRPVVRLQLPAAG